MTDRMNVLLINSHFPPDQGVGTFRIAKFAKYLTEFGFSVHVLTRKNYGEKSHTLCEDINAVRSINRTKLGSNLVLDRIFSTKSDEIRWILPMIRDAIEIIENNQIDAVVHSAPERLPLIGSIFIKRKTGVPYIVDLRDPLSLTYSKGNSGFKKNIYHQLVKILEPLIFRYTSGIILNNQRTLDMYCDRYPAQKYKMHVINNGYDPNDYKDIQPICGDGFRIIYPGRFRDDMRWFFEPFSKFVDEKPDVQFIHFGSKDRGYAPSVRNVVSELELDDSVSFNGYVDRSRVLAATLGANLGLSVTRRHDQTHAPTKIYDFMGCNIPILGVDDGVSAMRDILAELSNARTVTRSNSTEVYSALYSYYEDTPSTLNDTRTIERYTRKNLTYKLKELLGSTVKYE